MRLQRRNMKSQTPKLLELFAGSRSVGRVAESMGLEVFSVDWQAFDGIDLSKDIAELSLNDVPFIPDVIWASPDCTTYSIAAISTHRNGVEPKSDYAKKCDAVNKHFLGLIKQWQRLNPSLLVYVENPRGMFRKMPFIQHLRRQTVWYCTYGDDRAKPTDIFTNSVNWVARPSCRNGNPDCHHSPAPRGSRTGTQGRQGSYDRSRIPAELVREILHASVEPTACTNTLKF